MKISGQMNVFTIRKKILLASKLMGIILVLSYVFSTRLPLSADVSLIIWLIFVAALICAIDLWMARFISKPVSELNEAAGRMANLDFSHLCKVSGRDEFGELSHNLNIMAQNLQDAFGALEHANRKLEQDVEQKKRLLSERRELADSLSHEMKTPLGVIQAYTEGLQDETEEAKRQHYYEVIIKE
ncbi:MAG: HAMP domain-containing protein, partial [Lachnospiraceae bacterium]|nr:HAMP domain-containing protein [Lachnospiraceae bacterium]